MSHLCLVEPYEPICAPEHFRHYEPEAWEGIEAVCVEGETFAVPEWYHEWYQKESWYEGLADSFISSRFHTNVVSGKEECKHGWQEGKARQFNRLVAELDCTEEQRRRLFELSGFCKEDE